MNGDINPVRHRRQYGLSISCTALIVLVFSSLSCKFLGPAQTNSNANSASNNSSAANKNTAAPSPAAPKEVSKGGEKRPCSDETNLRSNGNDGAATLAIDNQTGHPVVIYWIDFDGKRKKYSDLANNQTVVENTFVGHWWLVADKDDDCIMIASAPGNIKVTKE